MVLVAITLTSLAVSKFGHFLPTPIFIAFNFVFVGMGSRLIMAFLLGILLFQMKHLVPYSSSLLALCLTSCLLAAFITDEFNIWIAILILPSLAYITIFLGLTDIPLPRVLRSGDYSYGIYLYHEPLQQVVIATTPVMLLGGLTGVSLLVCLSIPAVALLAMLSWHLIEKPILGLRKKFSFVARLRSV